MMKSSIIEVFDLNCIDYCEALELQEKIVSAKIEEKIEQDVILMLEHPPVFTLGKNGGRKNLKVSEAFLESKGIPIIQTKRGGNITFHGPGQLVVYPIVDITKAKIDVTDFVNHLEEVMIQTALDFGVEASRNVKNRGIWVDNSKIGSIGLSITKGISFHGLALNISLDLEPFSWINPCGMDKVSMTSMEQVLKKNGPLATIDMGEVKNRLLYHFSTKVF
ncbi:MAG: lipoyl(octanoyl) transferase LipB [Desulfobacteraceae bacterium]|nr:lipoyl(octanoyl) transferase LipB [Desulfobacteraceae bacterium]